MPSFTVPLRTDWTYAEGAPKQDRNYWGHFGTQPRGRSVIKIAGTWTTVDYPSASQINDATAVIDMNGQRVPGAFIGARTYQVTQTVADELTAAGYTVTADISIGGYEYGYAEGF